MSDLLRSIIRTGVPALVGFVVAILAKNNINVDEGTQTAAVQWLSGVGYYIAARVAEASFDPRFGWLLGAPGTPTYDERDDGAGGH